MDLMKSLISQECKKYKDLGFRRVKGTYVRVVNDCIIQQFRFKRRFPGSFDIDFCLTPLCAELNKYWYYPEVFELNRLDSNNYRGWDYIPLNDDSIRKCVDSMIYSIDNILMPIFDRADSYSSALQEVKNAYRIMFYNWREQCHNLEMKAEEYIETCHCDNDYYLALGAKDYEYASKYLRHIIWNNKEHVSKCQSEMSVARAETIERVVKFELLVEMIQNGAYRYFEDMVADNERHSREFLSLRENGGFFKYSR